MKQPPCELNWNKIQNMIYIASWGLIYSVVAQYQLVPYMIYLLPWTQYGTLQNILIYYTSAGSYCMKLAGVRLTFQTFCNAIRINSETCIADKIIL
jgi:hypothetical protein